MVINLPEGIPRPRLIRLRAMFIAKRIRLTTSIASFNRQRQRITTQLTRFQAKKDDVISVIAEINERLGR